MTIIDASISRSRALIMVLLLILISGSIAYKNIPKEDAPDVKIPIIYVSMSLEGISPEDGERLLVRPMEKELKSIEGVKEMRSNANQGHASVVLEFQAGFDSDSALQDVRDKVDIAKSELPNEADEPTVNEVNLSLFPIVNVVLTSSLPERAFIQLARSLRDEIEKLPSVLDVEIAGEREETVEVIIEPVTLEEYNLGIELIGVLTNNNKLITAGQINNNESGYKIKVPGLLESVDDILDLPVKSHQNSTITLEQIADVKAGFKDPEGFARVNGKTSLVLEVSKRTGKNIIDTVKDVRAVVDEHSKYWPDNVSHIIAQDKSADIIEMVSNLENNIFLAILLVVVLIIWFVGLRSGLFVAASIPGAFLMGILAISFMNLTLNIVVLFSLILSIGMLVDNAIVVIEYANRKMIEGVSYKKAYIIAAKRMSWPLIASTATTLMVFAPLLFWPGIIGQFMKYMPLTLIAILGASLIMALIFLPVLGTWFGKDGALDKKTKQTIITAESGDLKELQGFTKTYANLLEKVLKFPGFFALGTLGFLILIIISFNRFGAGDEFFPSIEPNNVQVQLRARGNMSVYEKDRILQTVEKRIIENMQDEIKIIYARSGNFDKGGKDYAQDVIGIVQLELKNWRFRRKANDILASIRDLTADIPGVIIETREEEMGPPTGRPINLEVSSIYGELLPPVVEKITSLINQDDRFIDVSNSLPITEIEWELDFDRKKAMNFGIDVLTLGSFVKLATNGLIASSYRPEENDDEVDIVIRFPASKRNIQQLDRIKVVTKDGAIPISNFVELVPNKTIQTVERVNSRRVLSIKSDVKEGLLADNLVKEMTQKLKELYDNGEIDPRVSVTFKGEQEDKKETSDFLGKAFMLALFGMALMLVIQFNSIYKTFIIMSAVFLSTAGVLLGLLVTSQPFGVVMCGVGIISLAGIVVNNNIIFIDTYSLLRKGSNGTPAMNALEAVIRTGVQRLRPILLTATTTVLGLMPMVMSMNIDFFTREVTFGAPSSQWWSQLSTAIAGGLTFATILTLFFTPCLLIIGEKFARKYNSPLAGKSESRK